MAAFALSSSPTTAFDPTADQLLIDTTTANNLTLRQVGANVIVTDTLGNTATLQNVLLAQIAITNFVTTDGGVVWIGDGANALADFGPNTINADEATAFNDYIMGLVGADIIDGLAGSDKIYGNQDNDAITGTGAAGNDVVFGGQGDDNINYNAATAGNQLIYGNLGRDQIFGGAGNDSLFGGQGDDFFISGRQGNDVIYGNLGLDFIEGGADNDTIRGGADEDTIDGGLGENLIYGNQGDDNIFGGTASVDTVFGGQGSDVINYTQLTAPDEALIYGNLGNDSILGGAGADTVFGGQGDDTMAGAVDAAGPAASHTGGLGADAFRFQTQTIVSVTTTSGMTAATADVVEDFQTGTDRIVSHIIDPVLFPAPGQGVAGTAANYRELADATVDDAAEAAARYGADALANLHYTFILGSNNTGYLVIDSNQGGIPDSVIVLNNMDSLDDFDFTDIKAS